MSRIPWSLLFVLVLWTLAPNLASAAGDPSEGVETEIPEDPFGPPPEGAVLGVEIGIDAPSGNSLESLHRALRRARDGEGKARILFFGASHVASDLFTSVTRRELQTRFGDAGHGFILPAKPWKYYRHRNIKIDSNKRWKTHKIKVHHTETQSLGLAGVAVESSSRRAYGIVETAKQHNFVYGLVSGKTPDTQEMAKGENNYEVTTVHSFIDGLVSALTGGLYNPTTVEVKR